MARQRGRRSGAHLEDQRYGIEIHKGAMSVGGAFLRAFYGEHLLVRTCLDLLVWLQ